VGLKRQSPKRGRDRDTSKSRSATKDGRAILPDQAPKRAQGTINQVGPCPAATVQLSHQAQLSSLLFGRRYAG
jgi:hypothetical protein